MARLTLCVYRCRRYSPGRARLRKAGCLTLCAYRCRRRVNRKPWHSITKTTKTAWLYSSGSLLRYQFFHFSRFLFFWRVADESIQATFEICVRKGRNRVESSLFVRKATFSWHFAHETHTLGAISQVSTQTSCTRTRFLHCASMGLTRSLPIGSLGLQKLKYMAERDGFGVVPGSPLILLKLGKKRAFRYPVPMPIHQANVEPLADSDAVRPHAVYFVDPFRQHAPLGIH